MTNGNAPSNPEPTKPIIRASKRVTIPASAVHFSLTISEAALVELDRIHEETFKAAHESRKLLWR